MRIPESKWPQEGYRIYCLLEDDRMIRYVGITSQSAKKRLSQHLSQRGVSYKINWIKKCAIEGTAITIHMFPKAMTLERAARVEAMVIAFLRKRCRLVNASSGGEPGRRQGSSSVLRKNKTGGAKSNGIKMPEPGTLLYTMLINDPITGVCEKIDIHQGIRANGIEPRLFGQPFVRSRYCGFDLLFRELRKRWSLRWLVVN